MTQANPTPDSTLQPAEDYVLLLTTLNSEAVVQQLVQELLQARLAACVNFWPVQSVYSWQGTIESSREWQLLIKTRRELAQSLADWFDTHHPYEVPELLVVNLEQGGDRYLAWLRSVT
jgi:periplasmic divalent cation tolerance protein